MILIDVNLYCISSFSMAVVHFHLEMKQNKKEILKKTLIKSLSLQFYQNIFGIFNIELEHWISAQQFHAHKYFHVKIKLKIWI